MTPPVQYSLVPTRPHERGGRRFAGALIASCLAHSWLAWESPYGASRPGERLPAALEVTLALPNERVERVAIEMPGSEAAPAVARPGRVAPRNNHTVSQPADVSWLTSQADPTYYPARQLDDYPRLAAPLVIPYPPRAGAEGVGGRAIVLLLIDAMGRIDESTLVEALPAGYFEDAVVSAFRATAFTPGRRNGLPVKSRVLIHVEFDPREAAAKIE